MRRIADVIVATLVSLLLVSSRSHGVIGRAEGGGGDVREAVVGVDSLNEALESLPLGGGLLKLVYNSSEGPRVMNTLELKSRRVTIQGQGSQGPFLTCNGDAPVIKIEGGNVELVDLAIRGCTNMAVELVSPRFSSEEWRIQILRCMFMGNSHAVKKENKGSERFGGDIKITGSEFISNIGSAVELYDFESLLISNSKFENNTSGHSGGGLMLYQRQHQKSWSLSVLQSVFKGNEAHWYGGGIHALSSANGTILVQDTEFVNNRGIVGGGLGVAAVFSSTNNSEAMLDLPNVTVHVSKSSFLGNRAFEYSGGGLSLGNITSAMLDSTRFQQCSAAKYGGGVIFDNQNVYNNKSWVFSIAKSVFEGNTAESVHGGGIFIRSYAPGMSVMTDTRFINNIASSGGGLHVLARQPVGSDEESAHLVPYLGVQISNCSFFRNRALQKSGGCADLNRISSIIVESSVFEECNSRTYGGALSLVFAYLGQPWLGSVTSSVFKGNKAELYTGGGIYFQSQNDGAIVMKDTNFSHNEAPWGGGFSPRAVLDATADFRDPYHYPNVTLSMSKCNFFKNRAPSGDGGAIFFQNITSAIVEECVIEECTADYGAGVAWSSDFMAGILVVRACSISRNAAIAHGGGLEFQLNGQLRVTECNFEANESGTDGGALYLLDAGKNPNGIVLSDSNFVGNKAQVGGVIHGMNVHEMVITRATFCNNTAIVGGAIVLSPGSTAAVRLMVTESEFVGNLAQGSLSSSGVLSDYVPFSGGGGAIAIIAFLRSKSGRKTSWAILFKSSIFKANAAENAGALLAISPENNRGIWLNIQESSFLENSAMKSGGAIVVDNPHEAGVVCAHGGAPKSLQEIYPAYCETWKRNTVKSGSIGDDVPHVVAALFLGRIELNQSHVEKAQSRPHFPPIATTIRDALNESRALGGIGQVELTAGCHEKKVALFGETKQFAVNGTAVFNDIHAWGPPGNYSITVMATNTIGLYKTEIIKTNLSFELRDCEIGEWSFMEGGEFLKCEHCNPKFFSLDPSSHVCEECRAHAECDSSNENPVHPLVPQDGYWHSSPFSKQIHKCISEVSCKYNGRKEMLQSFKAAQLPEQPMSISQAQYPLCSEGSDGPLCGSCKHFYGHVKNGQCAKCKSRYWPVMGILWGSSWMAFVMCVTIYGNFPSVRDDSEDIDIEGIELHARLYHEDNDHDGNMETGQGIATDSSEEQPISLGGDNSGKSSVQLFKIAINFFQVNSTALLMSFGWISYLRAWLEFQGMNISWLPIFTSFYLPSFWGFFSDPKFQCQDGTKRKVYITDNAAFLTGASSYGNWLVPQCAFRSRHDRAIIVAYLDIALPVALVATIAGFWICFRVFGRRLSNLKLEMKVILWTASLYAYNGLTKAFMGMFNCIGIDNNDPGDPLNAYSIEKGLYWVGDTDFHCFRGSQRIYSLVTGLIGASLFLVGLPFYLCTFLRRMRWQAQNPDFKNRYGFLYKTYRSQYCFWEAAVMVRKFLVTTIGVFAASLGSQLQGHLMMGVMVAATMAQLSSQPFIDPKLNLMESWSLITTCCTFYLGGAMNDRSQVWKGLLSGMVFILNLVFCGALSMTLWKSIVEEDILHRAKTSQWQSWVASLCTSSQKWCLGLYIRIRGWVSWQLRNWF